MTPFEKNKIAVDDAVSWLKSWFEKRNDAIQADPDVNYLEAGFVDSMGLMELIAAVEEKFGARFTETHFQDQRFSTIRGLAELIVEIRS